MQPLKKGIFRLTDRDSSEVQEPPSPYLAFENVAERYEHDGFVSAGNMKGTEEGLAICLHRIYQEFKAEAKDDRKQQEEHLGPMRTKIREHQGNIERLKRRIEQIEEQRKPEVRKQIDKLRQDMVEIRQHPESVVGEVPGRASFLIGLVILVCLSLYLFVFYSSASYSAFFKNFEPSEIGLVSSIFDAQAISKAFGDGVTELILILMMPFIFLGLGFLIHKFGETKSFGGYAKAAALIAVTFIFDGILAYEITGKIYRLEALSAFEQVPDYTLAAASHDVKFWLIIFAGFLVYLIWGFVFDFVMDEHQKMDAVTLALKNKEQAIAAAERTIADLDTQIDKITQAILKRETEVLKLQGIVQGTVFIGRDFERRISSFMVGWIHWLSANKRPAAEAARATQVSRIFLDNLESNADAPMSLTA